MNYKLVHVVPFDMGISFLNYEDSRKQSKEEFVKMLEDECRLYQFTITEGKKDIICSVKINEDIVCHLFSYGIGVFIIKNFDVEVDENLSKAFREIPVCQIYYKKKIEQKEILMGNSAAMQKSRTFMQIVWKIRKNKIRNFSSTISYKYGGLSYVLTIYYIVDKEINPKSREQTNLLMNPIILKDIQDPNKWESIKKQVDIYNCPDSNLEAYSDVTFVASSWSAVAVWVKEQTNDISNVIMYEAELQAVWCLFDTIINNLENVEIKNIELQKQKSIAANAFLNISGILNANMGSNEKQVFEKIYVTSGIEIIKEKCMMLLENRIAIEEAKHNKKQNIYGIITEILLVSFTLIQLFSPIKNLFFGEVTREDLIIGCVMILVLLLSAFLIVRKER